MAVTLLAGCGAEGGGITLNVYAVADGAKTVKEVAGDCSTDEYKVVGHALPKQADDQRLQIARRANGNDRTMDIVTLDVNWTAEFAEAGWILPVPESISEGAAKTVLAGPLKTAMWQDRQYAAPAWTNTQLLWYRKDALEKVLGRKIGNQPPRLTWDQVVEYAKKSGELGGPTQIEAQAAQYEGVVVWFNSLLESAGGRMVADDGKTVTLTDTPEHRAATVKALSIMKAVATAPGRDPSFTQLDENASRLGMETGKAIFQVNWPFVFASAQQNGAAGEVPYLTELTKFDALLNPPKDAENPPSPTVAQLNEINALTRQKFDFAPYPSVMAGRPAKTTVGGINFAVTKTTRYEKQAFDALACLTNEAAERKYAVKGGTPPILAKLYDDPEFRKAYPMASLIRDQLQDATAAVRPITPQYQAMSTLLQAKLAPVGSWDPETLADELTAAAQKAMDGKGLVP
ncbi:extracellular solute-binding protein [Tsukamurella asaccharolytica]|uniref:Extracellular solute-binding protein n=2 Tax=Tsukamurella asaccharolytica TaxID=2592067 RepID=A0A5C5R4T7_9ACTN|nr:extracellular solute-binding protein [Tsukamurella asaccharolytica]